MTPSQLYKEENQKGKLKAEIKSLLSTKALSRYEAEELIQLNVLGELEKARKINPLEIRRLKENHNMTPNEKLDIISHIYELNGFNVDTRDRFEITFTRKKRFSYLSAFLWFLLLGVGLVIYILYYLLKGDDFVSITVEDNYKEKPAEVVEKEKKILEILTEHPEEQESEELYEDKDAAEDIEKEVDQQLLEEIEEEIHKEEK